MGLLGEDWAEAQELVRYALAQRGAGARVAEGGKIRLGCPFCEKDSGKRDTKLALSLNPRTGLWYCWRCGRGSRLRGDDFADEEVQEQVRNAGPPQPAVLPPPPEYMAIGREPYASSSVTAEARRYIATRAPTSVWRELELGCCVDGFWAGRCIVPLLLSPGVWAGWSARTYIPGVEPKYRYPRGMTKGATFYNHRALRVPTEVPVLIVEGVFDALALYPHSAALLGTPSRHQIEAMADALRPVVFVLDGDAWEEGEALAWRLRFEGRSAGWVKLPPKVDPDEVPFDDLMDMAFDAVQPGR